MLKKTRVTLLARAGGARLADFCAQEPVRDIHVEIGGGNGYATTNVFGHVGAVSVVLHGASAARIDQLPRLPAAGLDDLCT